MKPLAPLKENGGGNNPRSIQVNFKATLVYDNDGSAGIDNGEYNINGGVETPIPKKGKQRLQSLERGGIKGAID